MIKELREKFIKCGELQISKAKKDCLAISDVFQETMVHDDAFTTLMFSDSLKMESLYREVFLAAEDRQPKSLIRSPALSERERELLIYFMVGGLMAL